MSACAWGGGQARLPNSEARGRCLRQRVLCHACQAHAGTGSSGGLERQTATEICGFLSGLDWSGERVVLGVKEDTEDMEVVGKIKETEGMEATEDMEGTMRGGCGGHGSRGGQEGGNINNIAILCNIAVTLFTNSVYFNDM